MPKILGIFACTQLKCTCSLRFYRYNHNVTWLSLSHWHLGELTVNPHCTTVENSLLWTSFFFITFWTKLFWNKCKVRFNAYIFIFCSSIGIVIVFTAIVSQYNLGNFWKKILGILKMESGNIANTCSSRVSYFFSSEINLRNNYFVTIRRKLYILICFPFLCACDEQFRATEQ